MPALTIKNIPDDLYNQLKTAAQVHHRSINGELIHCLETTLRPRQATPQDLIAAAQTLRARVKAEQIDVDDIENAKNEGRK